MFGFLKRAIGLAGAYSAGKAYEQSYKLAQLSTIIYLHKQCDGDDGERMATCVWSYLFCTEPTDQGLIEFRERWKTEIVNTATEILDTDEPFREVIVSSLWVALAVSRSRDDRDDFERITSSAVFKQYSTTHPMPPHDRYSALVEGWSRKYSPLPSAK
ncbi:MAG TPA: hypothetical protein VN911_11190 [Candidatus Acidoferrum sp.]|nr:hypothetical protein [Candidatus Acidoferrum sp.]